jgi:hypothetical protein
MRYHSASESKRLSWLWIIISLITFIIIELLLGGVIARLIAGRFVGHIFMLRIEVILILASYFLGGLIVGFFSPGIRILEPAIGAFFAVLFTFFYGFFTPHRFFGFSLNRLLIGGGIAFVLALFGADLGERLAARVGNRASKKYIKNS